MSVKEYENHLYERYKFYHKSLRRMRTDSEHPWEVERDNKFGPRVFLEQFPAVRKMYRALRGTPFVDRWDGYVKNDIDKHYEVRCMLNDQLSQLLYDEAVILRALLFGKFYFPRIDFDCIVDVLSQETFSESHFPDNYLGLPLKKLKINLKGASSERLLEIITHIPMINLLNSYRQYFIKRGSLDFRPSSGDVVFDCGACIGEVSAIFAGFVGETGKVHVFDPIPLHVKFCELQASLNPSLEHVFVFNQLAVGKYSDKTHRGQKVDSNSIAPGGLQIDNFDVTSLDDYVENNRIEVLDYIKMDIEGAECDAIAGAENVIKNLRPRLAISTYHKIDDFWSLPLQIKKLNPNYKFAFGHHTQTLGESVIYAYEE